MQPEPTGDSNSAVSQKASELPSPDSHHGIPVGEPAPPRDLRAGEGDGGAEAVAAPGAHRDGRATRPARLKGDASPVGILPNGAIVSTLQRASLHSI
ncbi:MAG: hypothetical protein INR71_07010 [Terriglobus roseus]|nr:hypothetical protein [Terriglobus roseus]